MRFSQFQPPGDYRILFTDYENIAVIYSYSAYLLGLVRLEYAWILARQPIISENLTNLAFGIFEERVGLKKEDFRQTPVGVAPGVVIDISDNLFDNIRW